MHVDYFLWCYYTVVMGVTSFIRGVSYYDFGGTLFNLCFKVFTSFLLEISYKDGDLMVSVVWCNL